MKFYYAGGMYFKTLKHAKDAARAATSSHFDEHVELVEVGNDSDNLLRLLNSSGGHQSSSQIVYSAKAKIKKG